MSEPGLGRTNTPAPFDAEVFVRECMSMGMVIEEKASKGELSVSDADEDYRLWIGVFAAKLEPIILENRRLRADLAEFREAHRGRMTR